MRYVAAFFALAFFAIPASAAVTLQVNGSGQLTGATGVNISGTLYDVTFVDGTCDSVFGVCDAAHFDFTTQAAADAASAALVSQVFVDGPQGQFDSDYTLTFGCSANSFFGGSCVALTPYSLTNFGGIFASDAFNFSAGATDSVGSTSGGVGDTSALNYFVFARYSLSPVPEPATWAMLLLGFAGIGLALRSSREGNGVPRQLA